MNAGRPDDVTPGRLIAAIRRRAWLIILCAVVAATVAYGYSRLTPRHYTATASLVFNDTQLSLQAAGLPTVNTSSQQTEQATNVQLTQLGDMAAQTAARIGEGLTEQTVRASLTISGVGLTNVVTVAATAKSPHLASEIANTYSMIFIGEQQNANHRYYRAALAVALRQLVALSSGQKVGPSGLALQDRVESLEALTELPSGTVQLAEAARVPTVPSSPQPGRDTVLGAIFGMILGFVLAVLRERADPLVRDPSDLETIYAVPLLGIIPKSHSLGRTRRHLRAKSGSLAAAEAGSFHMIRAHLRYSHVARDLRTLLVVSASSRDGKTTVATHLAIAAASMGTRVLLVEADLRHPTIAAALRIQPRPGLADALVGRVAGGASIQTVKVRAPSAAAERTLDVVVAGVVPPNASELLESRAMRGFLASVKSRYDLVIIDTPPLAAVSDAFPLLGLVDGVVVVGRVGHNRRDVSQWVHETLAGVGPPLLGVIANGVNARQAVPYGYGDVPAEVT